MRLKLIYEASQVDVDGYGSVSDLLQAYTCITHTVNLLLTGHFEIDKVKATAALAAAVTEAVNMPAEMFEAKIVEAEKETIEEV